MKIKEITHRHRRDFKAIYECEHCGYEKSGEGYDDDNFHVNVIPHMPCEKCGNVSPEDYVPRETLYPSWMVV